ncbi:MAG TPA: hypothetical protein VLM42_20225 [Bryobacteraceae bacterium]|nr:hypothetical protein [Bryobacteraceae bacterium]
MMKIAKLVVCLGTVAMAWASAAKPYEVNFNTPAQVSGTELKPGTYKVDVIGDRVMIHGAKQNVECSVKVEENDQKYSATTVRYGMVEGKYRVNEIHLGGTNMKLVFNN